MLEGVPGYSWVQMWVQVGPMSWSLDTRTPLACLGLVGPVIRCANLDSNPIQSILGWIRIRGLFQFQFDSTQKKVNSDSNSDSRILIDQGQNGPRDQVALPMTWYFISSDPISQKKAIQNAMPAQLSKHNLPYWAGASAQLSRPHALSSQGKGNPPPNRSQECVIQRKSCGNCGTYTDREVPQLHTPAPGAVPAWLPRVLPVPKKGETFRILRNYQPCYLG